jgi:hypothetical protein
MNNTTTTMTKEEEQTLDLLVRKLIKDNFKDATEEQLNWLVDDFHTDFIDFHCNEKLIGWSQQ